MMLIPVRFGARWNRCSSSLMAWISGTGFWGSELAPVKTFRRSGTSEIRTCFLGEEHSDQQVGGGGKPELDGSSSDEVEPGRSCPRWRCFLPAISPSQCRCLMWKTGSAEYRDSWADHGRVRRFLPMLASLESLKVLMLANTFIFWIRKSNVKSISYLWKCRELGKNLFF